MRRAFHGASVGKRNPSELSSALMLCTMMDTMMRNKLKRQESSISSFQGQHFVLMCDGNDKVGTRVGGKAIVVVER
jgi:hypothetical protein